MKKLYLFSAALLLATAAGLYGLNQYRAIKKDQQEQVASLLIRCVNQGLLALFRLQANNWRTRPDFYHQQEEALNASVQQLPQKLLQGEPFKKWKYAVKICEQLTTNSNLQHITIFKPLGKFSPSEISGIRHLRKRQFLHKRERMIGGLMESVQAASRYLPDLRRDINTQLQDFGFSDTEKAYILQRINAEVLDFYQPGNFSVKKAEIYLERISALNTLLAKNKDKYSFRGNSLYFHDQKFRSQVLDLNRAILQGEGTFFANYTQIVMQKQIPVQP
ncbi:hypothetical protein [Microbulbifer sp. 2205BS26-8]|uniref:hypothetical protein n=1 Tax=Microbulbifer sp. 2205BS26-8 TaxID=3064386 RepID=UPI0027401A86|nr:hypothetical protein [Microbulbifer sp. 2205BS26-8]MDP5209891.1 hypothetical protein [Microbulbifer sp. 2205BS26-8]